MADTTEKSTKTSLSELFERAGLAAPAEGSVRLRSLKRELNCLRFAQLYVKHNFNAGAAYREMNPRVQVHKIHGRAMRWMMSSQSGPRVAYHIRQIIQEATERAKSSALLDVQELLNINQTLITADATALVEQFEDPDTKRVLTRFKPVTQLTYEQRLSVQSIRIKDGEVTQMQTYNRLSAEAMQISLLEMLSQRGGSDQNWLGRFNSKIEEARRRRIVLEVEAAEKAGKVIRLPVGGKL